MYEVGPCAEIIHKLLMAGDPQHIYSNESERPNQDISDDLKLKKNPLFSMIYTQLF